MKKNKKQKHPTLFAFDGSLHVYEEGTMLELHGSVTEEEWGMIVQETVQYKVFLECLKEVAVPVLKEPWDEEDDWFRLQLGVAISRLKQIDPLLVAKYNQEEIKKSFSKEMKKGAKSMLEFIDHVKKEQKKAILDKLDNKKRIRVSGL